MTERTKDSVQLAESGDTEVLVGATTYTLNFVESVKPSNLLLAKQGLFSSLEENAEPIPAWAGEVTFVLCCNGGEKADENRVNLGLYLESSLAALSAAGGAHLSTLYCRFDDGGEEEVPNPSMTAQLMAATTATGGGPDDPPSPGGTKFTLPKKEQLCALKFGFGPQLWTILLCPTLFHKTAQLQPLVCVQNAVLAVHSFFTQDMSEADAVAELKSLAQIQETAARYSRLRGDPLVQGVVPSAHDAIALLGEVTAAYAPHSELLRNAVHVVKVACIDAPKDWEEEREMLEEEMSVLEELRVENSSKLKAKDERLATTEAEHVELQESHKALGETSLAQREHLTERCNSLSSELAGHKDSATKANRYSEALKRQLAGAEEKLARYALEVEQLSCLTSSIHADERRHMQQELSRMLDKIGEVEISVSEDVKRVESLKLDHQVTEYQTLLQRERQEKLKMVGEFQQKEFKWQKLLVDARDFKIGVLGENTRLKERTDRQLQSFVVAKKALADRQEQDDHAFNQALTAVREMSPTRRAAGSPNFASSTSSPLALASRSHTSTNGATGGALLQEYKPEATSLNNPTGSPASTKEILEEYSNLSGEGVRNLDI